MKEFLKCFEIRKFHNPNSTLEICNATILNKTNMYLKQNNTCNPLVTTNILFVTITKYFFLKKENSVIGYKRADRQHFTSF